MNQRHKDIIKRLRAVTEEYENAEDIPTWVTLHYAGGGGFAREYYVRTLTHPVAEIFNLADLLAIVRNVDIEEGKE